jgi:hypothetical protein
MAHEMEISGEQSNWLTLFNVTVRMDNLMMGSPGPLPGAFV